MSRILFWISFEEVTATPLTFTATDDLQAWSDSIDGIGGHIVGLSDDLAGWSDDQSPFLTHSAEFADDLNE